jgi:hypothetical protein
MPLSNKEVVAQHRARQKELLGDAEYKRIQAQKKKEYRARKAASSPASVVEAPAGAPPAMIRAEKEIKEIITLLNKYLTKESKITLPDLSSELEKRTLPALIELEANKGCQAVKKAVYLARKKLLEKKSEGKKNSKSLSFESFQTNTWANVIKIYKKMNNVKTYDCSNMEWLRNADEVIKFIKETYTKQNSFITNISSFATVTSVLKGYETAYKKYSGTSTDDRLEERKTAKQNKTTDSEKDKMVSMSVLKNLWRKPNLNDRDRALISLYTMIPPRRVAFTQYLTLKHSDKDLLEGFNYLIVDKGGNPQKMILKKYKTFHLYGVFEILLGKTDRLNGLLKTYIKSEKLKDGDLMFPNKSGGVYKNFSIEIINTFFKASGKKIGVDVIRHIWISKFLEKSRTIEQKEDFASQMGHDKDTAAFYNRVDAPKDDDDAIKADFYDDEEKEDTGVRRSARLKK